MNFFDQYPCFYATSIVGSTSNRLNSRYQALIQPNQDCIAGCSILDLASHDGRWSFAALQSGARHVLGIEAREEAVDAARKTFQAERIPGEMYRFVHGDVYRELPGIPAGTIDTVFCFGFFYHTLLHHHLLSLIAALKPKHLILDTCVFPSEDAVIHVRAEPIDTPGNIFPSPVDRLNTSLVGYPSRKQLDHVVSQGHRLSRGRTLA